MPFISRADFKDLHNMFPEEAKLDQIKVLDRSGNEVQGVVMATDRWPEIVLWTEKIWLKKTEEIKPEDVMCSRHVSVNFDSKVLQFQQNLGQSIGGKYQAKTKSVKTYSEEEVQEAIRKAMAAKVIKAEGLRSCTAIWRTTACRMRAVASSRLLVMVMLEMVQPAWQTTPSRALSLLRICQL